MRRYGAASGRHIRNAELAPYRKQASEFLALHSDAPQVTAALSVLTSYFNLCRAGNTPGAKWTRYAVTNGLSSREALVRSFGTWLMQRNRPHAFPADRFLTNELGRAIVGARPLPQRINRDGRVVGSREMTRTPRLEVGQFLRDSLGAFYIRAAEAIERERAHRRELGTMMAAPFPVALSDEQARA